MFRRLISCLFLVLIIAGCVEQVENEYMTDAVITGFDARECMCCGGLMINLNNNPKPYDDKFYQIDKMPDGFIFDGNTKFPVYVKIDWSASDRCGGNWYINITRMKIVKQ